MEKKGMGRVDAVQAANPEEGESPSPPKTLKRWKLNPAVMLGLLVFSIFSAEVLVMIVLGAVPIASKLPLPMLDAVLLSLVVFPFIYLLIFRPMKLYIEECTGYLEENMRLRSKLKQKAAPPEP